MKKSMIGLVLLTALSLSSCGTIFTSSKQNITFQGDKGIKIYDKGTQITEIGENGFATVGIRKKLSSKYLIAKKDGYKDAPLKIESTLNPVSVINLLNPIAWAVDLGTGKCCKYGDDLIIINLDAIPVKTSQTIPETNRNKQSTTD